MTDRIAEIAAREKAATPGPWIFAETGGVIRSSDMQDRAETWGDHYIEDGQFIAHARADIPWLLSQLRAYREALEKARRKES